MLLILKFCRWTNVVDEWKTNKVWSENLPFSFWNLHANTDALFRAVTDQDMQLANFCHTEGESALT